MSIVATKPEWIDAKEAMRLFTLGKTTLYALASEGKIVSSSLRQRGKKKGRRLFSYDSINAFIVAGITTGKGGAH